MEEESEENESGVLEFKVKSGCVDDFFPASVEFESSETFLPVKVCVWCECDVGGECGTSGRR